MMSASPQIANQRTGAAGLLDMTAALHLQEVVEAVSDDGPKDGKRDGPAAVRVLQYAVECRLRRAAGDNAPTLV